MPADDPRQPLALSPFLARLNQRHPEWLPELEASGRLSTSSPPAARDLDDVVEQHSLNAGLRRFRNREMLRITWREITGAAEVFETLADLSRLAELCLERALAHHHAALVERFGTPRDEEGRPQSLVVLGLGKLGGGELNLSSDIDLILAFPSAGSCDGRRALANEQFFTRLARAVIASLNEPTEDGFCFRVDTRLRPFGEAGPLVCSFSALEQYYQREGRDWERYALVKARPVAGDRAAGARCLQMLTPFVYRRYIDFGAVEALQEMLDAIRADAARRDRGDDVKRGPGGIREVEFLVQCVQLLRGGREPALRTPSIVAAMAALESLELLPAERVRVLRDAYAWLRRLENAIQALHDQQTHRLPTGEDLDRVARILRVESPPALRAELDARRCTVTATLEASFPRPAEAPETSTAWDERLCALEGPDWQAFLKRLRRLALSDRARRRLEDFMVLLIRSLEGRRMSADAQADIQSLVLAISRRSAYLALLVQNPPALERMLDLFQASGWVAGIVIRHPALLDELIDPALGRELPDRGDLALSMDRLAPRGEDPEAALGSLNYLKRAQSLRIAVAELEATIGSTEAEARLTELAELLVDRCLRLAVAGVEARHGPLPGGGLAVAGYGSLGAADMSFESDLDLVFLTADGQEASAGDRPLAPETWYTRVVRRLLALSTTMTPAGRLYEVDMRLRPNGRSGLLVSPISAFERYQQESAWVWEWQALTRARAVAGDAELGERFEAVRRTVLARPRDPGRLREEVPAMRARLRTQGGGDRFKQAPGGLHDIDFLAQLGVLEQAPAHAALRIPTDTRAQLRALATVDWLSREDAERLIDTHVALTRARHLEALCRGGSGTVPDTDTAAVICARYGLLDAGGGSESR